MDGDGQGWRMDSVDEQVEGGGGVFVERLPCLCGERFNGCKRADDSGDLGCGDDEDGIGMPA